MTDLFINFNACTGIFISAVARGKQCDSVGALLDSMIQDVNCSCPMAGADKALSAALAGAGWDERKAAAEVLQTFLNGNKKEIDASVKAAADCY